MKRLLILSLLIVACGAVVANATPITTSVNLYNDASATIGTVSVIRTTNGGGTGIDTLVIKGPTYSGALAGDKTLVLDCNGASAGGSWTAGQPTWGFTVTNGGYLLLPTNATGNQSDWVQELKSDAGESNGSGSLHTRRIFRSWLPWRIMRMIRPPAIITLPPYPPSLEACLFGRAMIRRGAGAQQ